MAEPSILGALRDPQFRSDTLRNLVEALNGAKRSLTVGSLGAVGDMGSTLANLVRAGAGTAYHEATGRPIPEALEYRDPARDFGTSASLGNFAESQGWLPPQTFSLPEQAGALLGPIAAMKAPDLAQSTLRGLVSALKSEPSRRMVEGYMSSMGMKPQAIEGKVNIPHQPIEPDDVMEARFIDRLHAPRDQKKLDALTSDMSKNGWTGRPLLAYEDGNGVHAITGSHRLAAAKKTNTPVPYVLVDESTLSYQNKHGQSIFDFIGNDDYYLADFLKRSGDKRAAALMRLENRD